MATRGGDDDAGRLVLANATPFLWKLSGSKKNRMAKWHFPSDVQPGQTVNCLVEFGGEGNGGPPHGEASYQVRFVAVIRSFAAIFSRVLACLLLY